MFKGSTSSAYVKLVTTLVLQRMMTVCEYLDDLSRSDHPSNNKRGGVEIYYKNFLPLKLIVINFKLVPKFGTLFLFIGRLVKQLIILIHFLTISNVT